ncbi:MAG: hypothetical protein PHU34_11420 [Candidatus Methanoperedens sp.]|nr:hypothetical protein [Candidatus Methanoperedens sp.]
MLLIINIPYKSGAVMKFRRAVCRDAAPRLCAGEGGEAGGGEVLMFIFLCTIFITFVCYSMRRWGCDPRPR